jgi:hypothetical protein
MNLKEICSQQPEFPHVVDSSMLAAFKACEHKGLLEYLYHLRRSDTSIHLVAGGAYAKALEVYRRSYYGEGKSYEDSVSAGFLAGLREWPIEVEDMEGEAKSLWNILLAFIETTKEWPPETDYIKPAKVNGRLGVEFTFAIPIPGIRHPVTGNPILYAGRFDELAEYNGGLFVEDDKTTGAIGPTWAGQWTLRSQFTGYCWAAKQYGIPVVGAIARGIALQKTQFKFAISIQMRSQWEIDRWLETTQKLLLRMVEAWKTMDFQYDLDSSCTLYGGCPYKTLCEKKNWRDWLEPEFVQRIWNPLEIHKVKEIKE